MSNLGSCAGKHDLQRTFENPMTWEERHYAMVKSNYYGERSRLEFLFPVQPSEYYKGYALTHEWFGFQGLSDNYDGPEDKVGLVTGNSIADLVDKIDEIERERIEHEYETFLDGPLYS